ncbi:MAG: hypothetical protein Q8L34_03005 [Candidatus Woesearchaeota archaeon]|nr:hypothetical protein [Candidatus Woesearchaeota archaeon]
MSEEHTKILKEILKWIKISGIKEVKSLLDVQIQNDSKKYVYQLSDGTKGTQEIAKVVGGLSHQSVANYWKAWEKIGLGESISAPGGKRFKRSFDLGDFGLKIHANLQKQEITEQTVNGVEQNA